MRLLHTILNFLPVIQVDPEVAYERAKQRASKGDEPLTLDYFKDLHSIYEQQMLSLDLEVLTLDASQTKITLAQQAAEWIYGKSQNSGKK